MKLNAILDALFPAGHTVKVANQVITGVAQTAQGAVAVLGTTDAAAIDHAMALALSGYILDTLEQHPGRPLVFLVDTSGQALSRSQELLCLNGSLAHLASCVDLARRQGHAVAQSGHRQRRQWRLPVLRPDGRPRPMRWPMPRYG
jgi:malonate decarboxylase gamma subunit